MFHLAFAEVDSYLWVPKEVITGEGYEGLLVANQTSNGGKIAILSSSDPSVLQVPKSVSIRPYSNHGMFPITPIKEGRADVFAVIDGKIISSSIIVHSSSRQAESLEILLPTNTTKAQAMLGYVISTDANGSPAPVSEDTQVILSASTPLLMISPSEITIPKGNYSARFVAETRGSGTVFASSDALPIAEKEITKAQDIVTVRLESAPNIMMKNSVGYFFVWLEKNGRPYKPPYVIHALLASNNPDSVRLAKSQTGADSVQHVSIVDGVGTGHLYSGDRGTAVISATVEEIGHAETNVIVGPVILDEGMNYVESEHNDKIGSIENQEPNIAFVWIYPDKTDQRAYGVIALYNTNNTEKATTLVSQNGTDVKVSSKMNAVRPVPLDGTMISLGSRSGLKIPQTLVLAQSSQPIIKNGLASNHATLFEAYAQIQGNYTVTVSGPGLKSFESHLIMSPASHEAYKIAITPIPTEGSGELAIISIVDESGSLIDAQKSFSGPLGISVSSGKSRTDLKISSSNSAVYSGRIDGSASIMVSAHGLDPEEKTITPSSIPSSVSLDLPPTVHVGELFPIAIHELDSLGIPIKKMGSNSLSYTDGVVQDGGHLSVSQIGTEEIAAVSNVGASSKRTESFANKMYLTITPNGTTNRVGKSFQLSLYSSVDDPQILISSSAPYKKKDNMTYIVTPNSEGSSAITFTASREGFELATKTFSFSAEKFVRLGIDAIATDGKHLNIQMPTHLGNSSNVVVTPFNAETRPVFLNAEFPVDFVQGSDGYRLKSLTYADQETPDVSITNLFLDKDTKIVASYERMVHIDIEGVQGSGYYPYGAKVILNVEPRDKAWFFVRDVFDHWDGLPYNTESIEINATKDIRAKAVLREDHTYLFFFASCSVSAVSYYGFVKRRGINVSYYIDLAASRLKDMVRKRLE